jgi:DNA primase
MAGMGRTMARFIPDEVLDEVRLRSDIVDVLQTYLPLKRAGGRLKALCPFHAEKTPSFVVNPERQSYHCFGCGRGGDVFRFVMERENVDFPTSVELLALRCGVDIPEEREVRRGGGRPSGAGEEAAPEAAGVTRPRLYQLHEDLAEWYADLLVRYPSGVIGQYAAGRGLDAETLAKFRLGASPDAWDETLNRCLRRGYTQAELLAAGVILENEERQSVYDRFRNRLMFPIWDEQGRVVAFSARTVSGESEGAKYVNSPETPIFRKGRVLYALPLAREGFRRHGCAILCEGQLDVIAMHRAGFDNAVAPQGTAFTEDQARILRRYTGTAVLAFDGDGAGQKAAVRALEILLPQDFEVRIVQFPAGADPDGLFTAGGREAIAPLVSGARDFFDAVCDQAAEGADAASPWGRRRVADAALRLLALVGNGVTRAAYCTRLAQRLGMPEETVFAELNRLRRQPAVGGRRPAESETPAPLHAAPACPGEAPPPDPAQRALAILLELALASGIYGQRLAEALPPAWAEGSTVGRALGQVVAMTLAGEWREATRRLAAGLAEAPDPQISRILADPQFEVTPGESVDSLDPLREKAYADALALLRRWHAQQEIERLHGELRRSPADASAILQRLAELKRQQIGLPAAAPWPAKASSPTPDIAAPGTPPDVGLDVAAGGAAAVDGDAEGESPDAEESYDGTF